MASPTDATALPTPERHEPGTNVVQEDTSVILTGNLLEMLAQPAQAK